MHLRLRMWAIAHAFETGYSVEKARPSRVFTACGRGV